MDELERFKAWLRGTKGWVARFDIPLLTAIPRNRGARFYSDYQEWLRQGKPATPTQAPTTPTPEDIESMSPEERSAHFGELQKGKEKPTFPIPEGYEFYRTQFDPETRLPLAESERRWGIRSIPEPETEVEDIDPFGMTDFQQEQVDRWRRQEEVGRKATARDWGFQQAGWGEKLQQSEMRANVFQKGMETAQIQRSLAGMGGRSTFAGGVAADQQRERDFEKMRQTLMSGLTGERDWLAREQIKLQPNRWTGAQLSPQENIADLESLEKYLKSAIQRSDTRIKSLSDPEGPGSENLELNRQTLRDTLSSVEEQITGVQFNVLSPGARQIASDLGLGQDGDFTDAYKAAVRFTGNPEAAEFQDRDFARGVQSIAVGEGLFPMSPAEPTGAEVPKWLPQFVPGLTGKYIPGTGGIKGKAPQITPFSPQQWRATPLKTRQKLSGYADFVGQDIGEMERRMWQRQPQDLRLGKTFRSSRQF